MNWDYFHLLKKHEEEKKNNALKAVLITVGVIAAVAAAAVVVYTIFKKYFTITFECDECDGCCDDDCCFEDLGEDELICSCEEDEECDAPEAAEA